MILRYSHQSTLSATSYSYLLSQSHVALRYCGILALTSFHHQNLHQQTLAEGEARFERATSYSYCIIYNKLAIYNPIRIATSKAFFKL